MMQIGTAHYPCVRITLYGNILHSCMRRTAEENLNSAKQALCLLLDVSPDFLFEIRDDGKSRFDDEDGKIEFYREY